MRIFRCGARRFHRWKPIVDAREPTVSFSNDGKEFVLSVTRQKDPHENVWYDYDVHLSLDDVALLLSTVAKDGINEAASDVRDALKRHLSQLAKLQACAKGFRLTRIKTPKRVDDAKTE